MKAFPLFSLLVCAVALCFVHSLSSQESKLTQVLEYRPAPGQFLHQGVTASDLDSRDYQAVLAEANRLLVEEGSLLSLGGWGGYVVLRMQPALINHPNQTDFVVLANSFKGSSEPGIVYVSRDENGNGLADDTWYQLRGSEYEREVHDYEVTYYKPKDPIKEGVAWSDSQGNRGVLERNKYHKKNSYYPLWEGEQITFRGALLPKCMYQDPESTWWILPAWDHGYVDNQPNNDPKAELDLADAVDDKGQPVELASVDFIKVQTGGFEDNPVTGELSTEVMGVRVLPKSSAIASLDQKSLQIRLSGDQIFLRGCAAGDLVSLYDLSGRLLLQSNSQGEAWSAPMPDGSAFVLSVTRHEQVLWSSRIVR